MLKPIHLIRLAWSYKIARSKRLSYPPYQFTVEPTNACNLRCVFCPQSDPKHRALRPVGRMSPDDFRIILKRIDESGSSNRNLNLTLDGEPFMNNKFLDLVELTIQSGRFPVFASNGTLIDLDMADRLVEAGPFRASIDFASDARIFKQIRGENGDFETVYRNLSYIAELSRNNRHVHLDIHDVTPFAGGDPEESLQALREMFPDDLPKRIRFSSREFHNFCGHLGEVIHDSDYRLCPYPWTQMAVTHSGDCVACCRDTAARSVFGNLFKQTVMEVWNGDTYRRFRQNLLDGHPDLNVACAKCDLPYSSGAARWKPRYILRSLLGR